MSWSNTIYFFFCSMICHRNPLTDAAVIYYLLLDALQFHDRNISIFIFLFTSVHLLRFCPFQPHMDFFNK